MSSGSSYRILPLVSFTVRPHKSHKCHNNFNYLAFIQTFYCNNIRMKKQFFFNFLSKTVEIILIVFNTMTYVPHYVHIYFFLFFCPLAGYVEDVATEVLALCKRGSEDQAGAQPEEPPSLSSGFQHPDKDAAVAEKRSRYQSHSRWGNWNPVYPAAAGKVLRILFTTHDGSGTLLCLPRWPQHIRTNCLYAMYRYFLQKRMITYG